MSLPFIVNKIPEIDESYIFHATYTNLYQHFDGSLVL
jgi:hypothetical protein